MIRTQNLCKIFGRGTNKIEAVKDVTLSIKKGETVAIVGKSGAGKSTLLHIMSGLDRPSSGKVFLNNVDVYKINEQKRARLRNRKIGFVYQFYNLLPDLTALENVMLPAMIGKISSRKQIKRKAEYLLYDVGLENRSKHVPSTLSGGEAQRVAIARSLINDPEIILCDEPTGNLDTVTSQQIQELLFKINKQKGMTLVIVTHNLNGDNHFDRVIEIRDGRII
ncbi:MAG: ABC transporter ATP-binding protein [Candidatus Omnitrophica bacterium]|nr:ABC transporter ATP-binding protein [Candidatus Omnitrophota bacterium]